MQDNQGTGETTLFGPDGRELDTSRTGSPQDDAAWADVGRQIERLLRRDVARLVGAEEASDWGAIKDALIGRAKTQAGSVDTGEVGRRVQEIGRKVEEQLRCGMTQATGAGRDADWSTIARTVRERIEEALDPSKLPFPGGSGTAADSEDVNVPAARSGPDREPTPATAGGEDTALPTVTEDVDAPAPKQPASKTGSAT